CRRVLFRSQQLQTLGEQLDMPVFEQGTDANPVDIAKDSIDYAKEHHHDYVLIDTAGRLHVDDDLMNELSDMKDTLNPEEIFRVDDSMTVHAAVNVAESFNEKLDVSGVVLSKLDGDTRGGAALSIRPVTDKPLELFGVGGKLDELEEFDPDRMASRILGMGDVLSLIEKAETNLDEKQAKEMQDKMRTASFTFDDFLEQMGQVK